MSLTVQTHGADGSAALEEGSPRVVDFNRPAVSAAGAAAVADALASGALKANGPYTRRCEDALRRALGCEGVVMTQSCTAALELAVLLLGVGPGDEVVMPERDLHRVVRPTVPDHRYWTLRHQIGDVGMALVGPGEPLLSPQSQLALAAIVQRPSLGRLLLHGLDLAARLKRRTQS